jgi:predicted transcriptional regulator of viral defense system
MTHGNDYGNYKKKFLNWTAKTFYFEKFLTWNPKTFCFEKFLTWNTKTSGNNVLVSDKERTMVDLIYWCDSVGGIVPAMEIIQNTIKKGQCDLEKFIQYAIKYPRQTVRKIIGVVLEKSKVPDNLTEPLYKTIENSSLTSANYNCRRGTKNKKWGVIIPDDTRG